MQDKESNLFQIELALNYSKHFNEAFLNCFIVYDRQGKQVVLPIQCFTKMHFKDNHIKLLHSNIPPPTLLTRMKILCYLPEQLVYVI